MAIVASKSKNRLCSHPCVWSISNITQSVCRLSDLSYRRSTADWFPQVLTRTAESLNLKAILGGSTSNGSES